MGEPVVSLLDWLRSPDEELRDRLVAEASEHVLSFDWLDIARQVGDVYDELADTRAGAAGSARPG